MIIIGILLNVAGLGTCWWALFTLAVYALPFFVGMTVGIYTYQIDIGLIGAVIIGFFAGALDNWSDNISSPLRVLPLFALSLACCLPFPLRMPAIVRLSV